MQLGPTSDKRNMSRTSSKCGTCPLRTILITPKCELRPEPNTDLFLSSIMCSPDQQD
nr:hypothetical protein Q903MT_gene124 [Picea sitchensis]